VKFLQTLMQKPWTADQIAIDNAEDGVAVALPPSKLGLRFFLGSITVLMSLFVIGYSDRMTLSDWHPVTEPWLLWINTGVIILSSVLMQTALVAIRGGRFDGVRTNFMLAGVCALVFLVGQIIACIQLINAGYFAADNPANAYFYLLTIAHGIHLSGGLVAWARVALRIRRGETDPRKLHESVDLCTVYWHYLLFVWLVFFTLLLFT
jgi:cytochrome c oxidase subunit 3